MPHKHKRREDDNTVFDLPPSTCAKPLPVHKQSKNDGPSKIEKLKSKTKSRGAQDDTPRAFARLMQFQTTGRPPPSGLDNGNSEKRSKKRKRTEAKSASDSITVPKPPVAELQQPKILPGERLSDFNLRVDQALPLSIPRHTNTPSSSSKIPGLKEQTTKHNRRLLKMQEAWREEERRRKEKKEADLDEMEDGREEESSQWSGVGSKKGKKGKHGKHGKAAHDDDDPWAVLAKSRQDTKQKNLQDVVQAPPQLKKIKSKFKDKGLEDAGVVVDVMNVPSSVGSLRKREEMGASRRAIIDGYRKMMRKEG